MFTNEEYEILNAIADDLYGRYFDDLELWEQDLVEYEARMARVI